MWGIPVFGVNDVHIHYRRLSGLSKMKESEMRAYIDQLKEAKHFCNLIEGERTHQIVSEGFTPEHDDAVNSDGQLAAAAAAYSLWGDSRFDRICKFWPSNWRMRASLGDKPYKERLVIAAALLCAEFERIKRLEKTQDETCDEGMIDDFGAPSANSNEETFEILNEFGTFSLPNLDAAIEFWDKERNKTMTEINITKADVGCRFRTRDGKIAMVTIVHDGDMYNSVSFAVEGETDTRYANKCGRASRAGYTIDRLSGFTKCTLDRKTPEFDLVERIDELPRLVIAEDDIGGLFLTANGQKAMVLRLNCSGTEVVYGVTHAGTCVCDIHGVIGERKDNPNNLIQRLES